MISEFQAFKHMESPSEGDLQKATSPLEATVSVHPPVVLHNALPYTMRISVWQVRPSLSFMILLVKMHILHAWKS